ncbi:hypothetical protein LOD99_3053 [Oopsacas minuta]|uniref:Dystroglycan n=1 Tax=Oopsacas minuta TaxID=111878 RepID=A0AAV7JZ09_9METZ|nr:hypothetical protein LOD99_3053 [Oopsacas minuta]
MVPGTSSSIPVSSSEIPETSTTLISSSMVTGTSTGILITSSIISVTSIAPTASATPTPTPIPNLSVVLTNPLPLLIPSPGVTYHYNIPSNTFTDPEGDVIALGLTSLVGELPEWLNLSPTNTGYQLMMLPPIDSGDKIFYAALIATDSSGQTATDVISIRPDIFTPPLHSVDVTITTNLSEILARGISVRLSLSEIISNATNSTIRLLGLSDGSTVISVSFVGLEVTRNCSDILAIFSKIQHSNGSYTEKFSAAFAPDYTLGKSAIGRGFCLSEGTVPPTPSLPSLSGTFSDLIIFVTSTGIAIMLAILIFSICCITICCCYRQRRYASLSPAERKAFLKRRPVVMDTDRLLAPKARRATILPTDLEHIPEEERWLLGSQPPPALSRPPEPRAPPPFQ